MGRVDYFDDPAAPKVNSIVPAVTVAVADAAGRLLMIRRADNGLWAMPGGQIDFGESASEAAVRETKEETGIDVEVTGFIGVYSDPRHVTAFSDGEVRQQFSLCVSARILGGELQTSDESPEVRFVAPADLDALDIHSSMRLRIDHVLSGNHTPYLG